MVLVTGTGKFRRWLRAPNAMLFCGLIAACASPLSAQRFSHIRLVAFPATPSFSTQFAPLIGQGSMQIRTTGPLTSSGMAQNNSELMEPLHDSPDFMQGLDSVVEFSGTPFTQQVRMPLGSLLGGRIRFGGFNAVTPMEHIQRGLPGGGSMDAWSPVPMGHAGMILPRDDNQYGLSLTFHLAGNAEEARIAKWNGLASWLVKNDFW
jgi:hypothetical protein